MAGSEEDIKQNFLWWITVEDDKLALGRLDRTENEVETLEDTYDVKFYYRKYPTSLIGADITSDEPDIPERFQLGLVDWVLQHLARNAKETLALSNYYKGHWENAVKRAKKELNENKGAKQDMTKPVDF